jgi:WD40 repeat protein
MAVQLLTVMGKPYLLTGWESGMTAVQVYASSPGGGNWRSVYASTPHSQPILSLSVLPMNDNFSSHGKYFTSAADSLIACHTIPMPRSSSMEVLFTDPELPKVIDTKHAGQQSLHMRNDGKIFATAGWDGRVRVYSTKTMRELACLKWHREGIYAVAFAEVVDQKSDDLAGGRLETESVGGRRAEECNSNHGECKIGSNIHGRTGQELTRGENREEALVIEPNTMTVSEQRKQQTQHTHWLAAGSKDGKISLWDIY